MTRYNLLLNEQYKNVKYDINSIKHGGRSKSAEVLYVIECNISLKQTMSTRCFI